MKKNLFLRIVFYVAGLLILALGIILNTKSGLGVSPIISVAYSITTIGGFNFGNITFLLYSAFVVVEIVLHIFRNHRYSGEAGGAIAPAAHRNLKLVLVMDLLQLPLSLVFTRFMNLFSALLPTPSDHPYDLPVPGSTNIKLIINDHIQSPVINSLFFHHLLYNNIVRKKFTLFPASRKRSVYIFPDLISGVEENRYVGEYLCHDGSVDCH